MFKFGSPFTAMFSPAPAAPERVDVESGKKNSFSEVAAASVSTPAASGIMDSVTSSLGSLFTNAPDRWGWDFLVLNVCVVMDGDSIF